MIDTDTIKSPEDYGATLHIDKPGMFDPLLPVALDVETDEKDNFVGLAMCQSDNDVYYWSKEQMGEEFASFIGAFNFIMHGGKFDVRMLKKWGVDVDYNSLQYDTKIMAYTIDSTLQSYGLKALARDYCGLEWSTYKSMVGSGKRKVTLDKQPVERVAKYCGMDTLAEWKLYNHFKKLMSENQHKYFTDLEMPLYRLLSKMEDKGVYLDVDYLKQLDEDLNKDIIKWETKLKVYGDFNPRSPKQLLDVLKFNKIPVTSTDVKALAQFKDHPLVKTLLEYRKFKKLKSTYTEPFLEALTLPYIHATFTQSTITGRLASKKPNLQNIPVRSEEGQKIRRAFCFPEGAKLLCLDYSQIEYRLFAHFTQDSVLINAFKNKEDVHESTGNVIGADRRTGKTINFAAIYGAQSKRIAQTARISQQRAQELLDKYWEKLPGAATWISTQKWKARKNGGVTTLLGRFIPLTGLYSKNKFERLHWERVAVNAIIQGSAAEIIKKAMLELEKKGFVPVMQVHDELMFYLKEDKKKEIKEIMENAVKISVPLEVEGGYGTNWADAK